MTNIVEAVLKRRISAKGARRSRAAALPPARRAAMNDVDARGTREQMAQQLPKTPTGLIGLDDLTLGGLPTGRPTLLCGDTSP